MEALDVSRADTRVWLVKVPTAVAQLWRPRCEQSMRSTSIDEDDGAVELGTIRTVAGQQEDGVQKTSVLLTLKGVPPGVPSQYRMNEIPLQGGAATMAISYKAPDQEGEEPSQMRVDGTVKRSFNLMPVHKVDENGQIEIDAAYRKLSKERSNQAEQKAHPVQRYEDTRENRVATLANTKAIMDQKRRAEAVRVSKLENKRLRKDKAELEAELFRLFERQPSWSFVHLQNETRQPAQYLKEVLNQIASSVKRGPGKELYELKNEYKSKTDD